MIILLDLLGYPSTSHKTFIVIVFVLLGILWNNLLLARAMLLRIVRHDCVALRNWLNRVLASFSDHLKVD